MLNRFIKTSDRDDRAIGLWLLVVAFLVFCMIVVGGATRLTESGLSMVRWEPISGVLPPMSEAAWAEEFAAYQAYPEFRLKNMGMTLAEFKNIFYWEYGHRLLGRLIGLAFALPLLYFVARRRVKEGLKLKLFALLALGGSQGLLGWYMVQSGLVDVPSVSQYRLAAHLLLALFILSALIWVANSLLRPSPNTSANDALRTRGYILFGLLSVQVFFGALVAGLDAGKTFNTWPAMDGGFLPPGFLSLSPVYLNFFENHGTVQWVHRMGAYLVFAYAVYFSIWVARQDKAAMRALHPFLGILPVQIVVGIITLLTVVPVGLGTLHQGVGALMVASLIWFLSEQRKDMA